MALIVKKYGGLTLSTPEKILSIAKAINAEYKTGNKIVVVVSAMGNSTDELHTLAQKISKNPKKRELDMLLSTGERVSMALLSMALNEIGCPAVSFTGSQAGVITSESHINAMIKNVTPVRVQDSLTKNQVVVLAGFQGVSSKTKEITTLGRGGSDVTAVAIANALKADTCEILKDISGMYSADPKKIAKAHLLTHINFQHLLHMTFWGAKALNFRAAEIASLNQQKIFIGNAIKTKNENGTTITGDKMFEQTKILSINSFKKVIQVSVKKVFLTEALDSLKSFLDKNEIGFPQVLKMTPQGNETLFWITGPTEVLSAIENQIPSQSTISLIDNSNTVVSTTHTTATSPELLTKLFSNVSKEFKIQDILFSANGAHFMVPQNQSDLLIEKLHSLLD